MREVTKTPLMLTGGMRTAETMAEVIRSGAVDVVGMARPLSFEPDLPKQILSGERDGAKVVKLSTGVKKVDDMLQIFWFQKQLHRMADGLEPDPSLGRWAALTSGVKHTLFPAKLSHEKVPVPATGT